MQRYNVNVAMQRRLLTASVGGGVQQQLVTPAIASKTDKEQMTLPY